MKVTDQGGKTTIKLGDRKVRKTAPKHSLFECLFMSIDI